MLIAWAYSHTGSLLVAQLLHASSTGSLVLFSPLTVTPAQEALWYAGYALVLWAAVAAITYLDPSLRAPSGALQEALEEREAFDVLDQQLSPQDHPAPGGQRQQQPEQPQAEPYRR